MVTLYAPVRIIPTQEAVQALGAKQVTEAARYASKAFRFVRRLHTNLPIDFVNGQILTGAELEPFAQFLWNNDLKFWGNSDRLHIRNLHSFYR